MKGSSAKTDILVLIIFKKNVFYWCWFIHFKKGVFKYWQETSVNHLTNIGICINHQQLIDTTIVQLY